MQNALGKSSSQDWNQLQLIGGCLCLDFINTVDRQADDYCDDYLNTYTDLVVWGQYAHILNDQEAKHLLELATQESELARQIHSESITFREVCYRAFSAVAVKNAATEQDLYLFNEFLSRTLACLQVTPVEQGFSWSWRESSDSLHLILWHVVRSAADLLTSNELHRVRICAAEDCNWIFLDTSRNRARRWCDMESCGNRAKAHRHYTRRKQQLA